ncbi:hypothetical protein SAMN05443550_102376 [Pedobacter hartonius]|uniref:Uncharacterized protein n=1 Tax=Pedobacter hartonius TaxID=425514 RepID=A0A1H3ZII8_9SPHI|nr:hypothetical protein SAMN05443550_102376 [Pedobacter hartonius]
MLIIRPFIGKQQAKESTNIAKYLGYTDRILCFRLGRFWFAFDGELMGGWFG